jgi:sugar (pentulose or hexulose) kinase
MNAALALGLGLDFGTSGARCCVIEPGFDARIVFEASHPFPAPRAQTPQHWTDALAALLATIPAALRAQLAYAAICATSGTVLLADAALRPIGPALAYFDTRAESIAQDLSKSLNPPAQVDALARLAWLWHEQEHEQDPRQNHSRPVAHALHQADWIAAQLLDHVPATDWHNALKSGADVATQRWPARVLALPFGNLLPAIVAPGSDFGTIAADAATCFGLPATLRIRAGTTDANAAFLATGASKPGQAVTSLGSTLALKVLSTTRVDAPDFGVYSHRFGDLWLASGASNAGGVALRQLFTDAELQALSARIDPEADSPLNLYPLPAPGERFPLRDPTMQPRLHPRPADDAAYLHGLLQGLARIETAGYVRLVELGATPPCEVMTTGGGARNPVWTRLRERALGLPLRQAKQTDAAFGVARLAMDLK